MRICKIKQLILTTDFVEVFAELVSPSSELYIRHSFSSDGIAVVEVEDTDDGTVFTAISPVALLPDGSWDVAMDYNNYLGMARVGSNIETVSAYHDIRAYPMTQQHLAIIRKEHQEDEEKRAKRGS